MAYVSEQTGRAEVWVRPFPSGGRAVQISRDGGNEPLWGRHGTEISYRTPTDEMVAAEVTVEPTFSLRATRVLFEGPGRAFLASGQGAFYEPGERTLGYDATADGRRFVMRRPYASTPFEMVRVENFMEVVRRAFER